MCNLCFVSMFPARTCSDIRTWRYLALSYLDDVDDCGLKSLKEFTYSAMHFHPHHASQFASEYVLVESIVKESGILSPSPDSPEWNVLLQSCGHIDDWRRIAPELIRSGEGLLRRFTREVKVYDEELFEMYMFVADVYNKTK